MTFYDKYPQLREREFIAKVLIETVFSTMLLEDQEVPKSKVQEIVIALLEKQHLEDFLPVTGSGLYRPA